MCQVSSVRGLLEIYKLEIFEANCGLASDARGWLSLYWIEMKLQYMYLDSALDLWPPGHFALGFFASRIERSEMKCSALGFSYVRWKPRNEQLAKLGTFRQRKRSDNKWYAVKVRWDIFIENYNYHVAAIALGKHTCSYLPFYGLFQWICSGDETFLFFYFSAVATGINTGEVIKKIASIFFFCWWCSSQTELKISFCNKH